jgi:hypothetical protein
LCREDGEKDKSAYERIDHDRNLAVLRSELSVFYLKCSSWTTVQLIEALAKIDMRAIALWRPVRELVWQLPRRGFSDSILASLVWRERSPG